jgi:hypothetical protein
MHMNLVARRTIDYESAVEYAAIFDGESGFDYTDPLGVAHPVLVGI